jgi:hypothetical protein
MTRTIAAIWLSSALWGCSSASPPVPDPVDAEPAQVANPLLGTRAPTPSEREFGGVVTDRLAAGGYTYVAIARDDGGPSWVATMGRGADVGRRVRVEAFAAADDFHSRRLGRRFARVLFGVVQ